MRYTELNIGNNTYELRLTTKGLIQLEKVLGFNPINMFMQIDEGVLPKVSDMLTMLNIMLSFGDHKISLDKTYDLFDTYLADGHNMFDLVPVFVEVFKSAGFINADTADEGTEIKNVQ